jgi:hypothetical protein
VVLTAAGGEKIRSAAPGHARLVQEVVIKPLSTLQLRHLGDAAATVVHAIDAASRIRKLADAQPPDSPEGCPS